MMYREISLARLMNLIIKKQTSKVYYQDKSNSNLYRFDNTEWSPSKYHNFRFFEKEGK